jgi:hypothetical protein
MAPRDQECVPAQRALASIVARARDAIAPYFADDTRFAARLDALADRLGAGRLQLAVLGQFKRGKSSFINALLGVPLLPSGVVPVTAIPTYIAWGASPLVEVWFHDGRAPTLFHPSDADATREIVARFVAEEANRENRLNVSRVQVSFPADFLRGGIVLIDTPASVRHCGTTRMRR